MNPRSHVLVVEFHQGTAVILKSGHAADFSVIEEHQYGFQFDIVGNFKLDKDRNHQRVNFDGLSLCGRFNGDDRGVLVGTRVKGGNGINPFVTSCGHDKGCRESQEIF